MVYVASTDFVKNFSFAKRNVRNGHFSFEFCAYFSRDLSSTSLLAIPWEGLQSLEILRIQRTHSLKTIPSIYEFKVIVLEIFLSFCK